VIPVQYCARTVEEGEELVRALRDHAAMHPMARTIEESDGLTAAYAETLHPRAPAGSKGGGRWIVKGTLGSSDFLAKDGTVYRVPTDAPADANGNPMGARWESSEAHWDTYREMPGTLQKEATDNLGPQGPATLDDQIDAIPEGGEGPVGLDVIRREDGRFKLMSVDHSASPGRPNLYAMKEGTRDEILGLAKERHAQARDSGETMIEGLDTKGRVTLSMERVPNAWAVDEGYADFVKKPLRGGYGDVGGRSAVGLKDNPWGIKWKPGVNPEAVLVHWRGGVRPPANFVPGEEGFDQFAYGTRQGTKGLTSKAKREAEVRRIMGLNASLVAAGFVFEPLTLDFLTAAFDESKHPRNPAKGRNRQRDPDEGGRFASHKGGGPGKDDGEKKGERTVEEILDGHPDTQQKWKPGGKMENGEYVGGEWEMERVTDVHVPWIAHHLDEGAPVDGQPTALFMAGGGGSGKGTVRKETIAVPDHSVVVDADEFKYKTPEFKEAVAAGHIEQAAGIVHEESSEVAKSLQKQAIKMNSNIVVDGTGNNGPDKFMRKLNEARDAGYRVEVALVDIPTEVAVDRALIRANDPKSESYGRLPDLNVLRQAHRQVTINHLDWREKVDDWQVWANDSRETRRVIAYREGGGPIVVVDPDRYDQMLTKAGG
jgi:predicted ABC-type ATPase